MKNSLNLTLITLTALAVSLFSNFSASAIKLGSFSVSDEEIELYVGETKDITVSVEDLTGRFDIYSKDESIASFTDNLKDENRNIVDNKLIAWLESGEENEENEVILTIKGNQAGETYILVEPVDVTDLPSQSLATDLEPVSIKVTVKALPESPNTGNNQSGGDFIKSSFPIILAGTTVVIVTIGAFVIVRKLKR